MNKDSQYLNFDNVNKLEKAVTKYVEDKIYSYLYKISKELKSDIDSFGKHVVQNFSTFEEWESFNWLDHFKDSFFNVSVDTTIKSSYILMES